MRFFIFFFTLFLLGGCSDSQPPASTSSKNMNSDSAVKNVEPTEAEDPWQVIEAFEVGREVYVRSLAVEPARNSLWVGTSVGVHEVDLATQELRNTFTRADGLANEYVFAIHVARDGYKWFGTNGGGMSRYRDGEWKTYFPMHGLADYWVYSFGQQQDAALWVGTWAGVNLWQGDETPMKTFFDELVNEWVYGISVDSKNRVWFGTEGGVSMFDAKGPNGGSWQAWTHKEGLGAANEKNLPISLNTGLGTRSRHDLNVTSEGQATYNPNYVFCIHVAQDDTVWAGTWGGGVSRFDGKQWQNYSSKDGLVGDVVYSIAQAEDGTMWFGTNKGLSRFDGKQWASYDHKTGLLSDHVYAIAVVPNGEVWVGTRGGVTRLGLKENQVTSDIETGRSQ